MMRHTLHTGGVVGSIPTSPTIKTSMKSETLSVVARPSIGAVMHVYVVNMRGTIHVRSHQGDTVVAC